jgi:hypothetical protein
VKDNNGGGKLIESELTTEPFDDFKERIFHIVCGFFGLF